MASTSSHRKGEEMSSQHVANSGILEVIVRSPGISLDEIVLECPGLTWNQVFNEIDRLSREGNIQLSLKGRGIYSVTTVLRSGLGHERRAQMPQAGEADLGSQCGATES